MSHQYQSRDVLLFGVFYHTFSQYTYPDSLSLTVGINSIEYDL